MCGIVGYLGEDEAYPILIDALRRLEYRGYDSAGIAVSCDGRIEIARQKGKVDELARLCAGGFKGSLGLAHTRWATHGTPSERNAHPHRAGDVVVVHNGIVENYVELKEGLRLEGAQIPLRYGHGGHTAPHLRPYGRRRRLYGSGPAFPRRDARLLRPRHHQGIRADAHRREKGESPRARHRRRGVLHRERRPRPHREDEQVHLPGGQRHGRHERGRTAAPGRGRQPGGAAGAHASTGRAPWRRRAATSISC